MRDKKVNLHDTMDAKTGYLLGLDIAVDQAVEKANAFRDAVVKKLEEMSEYSVSVDAYDERVNSLIAEIRGGE